MAYVRQKALAQNFYGIKDVELIKATGLDIQGNDAEGIVEKCISRFHRKECRKDM